MKKNLLTIISLILFTVSTQAQSLITSTKTYGGGYTITVIQPTIDNLIKLCDMSESQFIAAMKANKYFKIDETANPIGYWNGSIDNFAYAFVVNSFYRDILSDETEYMVKKEYIYPQSSMTDLIRSLKPYYYARKALFYDTPSDVFKIERNGKVYGIFLTDLGELYDVRIRTFAN